MPDNVPAIEQAPDAPSRGFAGRTAAAGVAPRLVFQVTDLSVAYSGFTAVRDVNLDIRANEITAFIGPSGCGKSTVLRCFNRMNDTIKGAKVSGSVQYEEQSRA